MSSKCETRVGYALVAQYYRAVESCQKTALALYYCHAERDRDRQASFSIHTVITSYTPHGS